MREQLPFRIVFLLVLVLVLVLVYPNLTVGQGSGVRRNRPRSDHPRSALFLVAPPL